MGGPASVAAEYSAAPEPELHLSGSGCELVAEAGESAGPGREGWLAGVPVGVEADDVDGGGGEGVLEADLGQAAVAGPSEAGDVEGLVDGALDSGAECVLGLPGLRGLLGPGIGQGPASQPAAAAARASNAARTLSPASSVRFRSRTALITWVESVRCLPPAPIRPWSLQTSRSRSNTARSMPCSASRALNRDNTVAWKPVSVSSAPFAYFQSIARTAIAAACRSQVLREL